MTHAELKARIDSGLPFTLRVADGRSIAVPHRDYIFLAPKSSFVVVATPNPDNENESVTDTIPLLLVSGVTQNSPSHHVAED